MTGAQPSGNTQVRGAVVGAVVGALGIAFAVACARGPRSAPAPVTLPDTLRSILVRAHTDSIFPGAIAVIGTRDRICAQVAIGSTDWAPGSAAIDAATLWDLASLTKLVALTTTVATLVDDHRLSLDDTVRRWVPEWRIAGNEGITVRDLLTHRSGLPAFKLYFRMAIGRDTVRSLVLAEPLETAPRTKMVYSDIGAIILGIVVERVTAQSFDAAVQSRVLAPLGMTETMFNPPASFRPRIAATENDPWRGRLLVGEVHDENTFALGGISSHAGLFSTAGDMVRFARLWLGNGTLGDRQLITPATARAFTTVDDSTFSSRAIGWDTPTGDNSAGTRMKRPAFGHTGFTGTSVWIDPARNLFVVLLTNRVDPSRARTGIGAVRIAVADAAAGYGCR